MFRYDTDLDISKLQFVWIKLNNRLIVMVNLMMSLQRKNKMYNNQMIKCIRILFLPILLLSSCEDSNVVSEENKLRPIKSMVVKIPNSNVVHEFSAVVDASKKADLSFKISGELVELNVKQGEEVEIGRVIAKLNDRDIKIQLNEAKSLFDKARNDYERGKNLIKSNAISQSDIDQLRTQFNGAQAKLSIAENNLEYTELKASFDGIIAKKYTENFQEINAKSPIVALHDLANIVLKIYVPESIMINMQREEVPPELSATFDAISDKSFPLIFKEVSTQADDITKTYQVTLSMKAPKSHTILPGMTAMVKAESLLSRSLETQPFYLPSNTVLKDTNGNFVFTVKEVADGIGQIKRRSVSVGDLTPLGLEVFSGIEEGDVIVTAGMSKVIDGMEVKY